MTSSNQSLPNLISSTGAKLRSLMNIFVLFLAQEKRCAFLWGRVCVPGQTTALRMGTAGWCGAVPDAHSARCSQHFWSFPWKRKFSSFLFSFLSYRRKIASVPYAIADAIQVVSNFNPTSWKNLHFTLILESLGGLCCRCVYINPLILN